MTAAEFYAQVLAPAAAMQPIQVLRSEASDVVLMAAAGHESDYTYFRQIPTGPGRGPWMFGPTTTALVLSNHATKTMAAAVCTTFNVTADTAYTLLPTNLPLAYAFARLLLWADPYPLPSPGDDDDAWQTYLRVWRPGIQRSETWAGIYATALEVVTEAHKAAPTA